MSLKNRKLEYSLAINEAITQMMAQDKSVFLMGQGVKSPWYVGNTAKGLLERFGSERVIDTPVSENAVTGAGVGAAIAGMRPIVVHPRMDFMLYAMDPIINQAANLHYMSGGKISVPVVIWGIINRGGEQAAQHSQALHGLFCHIPGLKIVMPSTPYDAKGLMVSALLDDNPVIYIDDRWLYATKGYVPAGMYSVPIGKGIIRKKGTDITIVAASYMAFKSLKIARMLKDEGIEAEVIDLRTIKPLDTKLILGSVKKTGRLAIIDGGWKTCGIAAEINTQVTENIFKYLIEAPIRITLLDIPAPASSNLEKVYYPQEENIISTIKKVCRGKRTRPKT